MLVCNPCPQCVCVCMCVCCLWVVCVCAPRMCLSVNYNAIKFTQTPQTSTCFKSHTHTHHIYNFLSFVDDEHVKPDRYWRLVNIYTRRPKHESTCRLLLLLVMADLRLVRACVQIMSQTSHLSFLNVLALKCLVLSFTKELLLDVGQLAGSSGGETKRRPGAGDCHLFGRSRI
jgi:hypothetical protein